MEQLFQVTFNSDTMPAKLEDVKPGDFVKLVQSRGMYESVVTARRVERVTKTLVVVDGINDARFSKRDGRGRGDSYSARKYHIAPITELAIEHAIARRMEIDFTQKIDILTSKFEKLVKLTRDNAVDSDASRLDSIKGRTAAIEALTDKIDAMADDLVLQG